MKLFTSVALAILVSATAFAQPYTRQTTPQVLTPETQMLWSAYDRAIYDSSVYVRWNIRKLRPLAPDATGMVKVATLTSANGTVGQTVTAGAGGIWVTGYPEVQTICRQFRGDIDMQLRQLIGLPPDADIPRVITYTAKVSDIFRPAVDDAVTTEYPCTPNAQGFLPADCGNVYPADTTASHYQWMAQQELGLHAIPDGYPWTHLGYTYNWKPGADRYGASEYLIRQGAQVVIAEVSTPAQYCAPPPAQ